MNHDTPNNFNWEIYENGYNGSTKLIPNRAINGNSKGNKCFSREPYAQQLFDIFTNQDSELLKKDLKKGDFVPITDMLNPDNQFIDVELSGGLISTVDLSREKKFIQAYGYSNPKHLTDDLRDSNFKRQFLSKNLTAYIVESTPSVKISLWQGHLSAVRDEFMKEITNSSKAYIAKINEANKGGFFVEVQGIEAFMPGSLAAPNKIIDFQSYVGKEIPVMIEDFLKELNSFIVSHKKYLAHILPAKMQELDLMKKYTGNITGTSKYGIFVEFNELFTGLLHTSKMDDDTKMTFNARKFSPGDPIEFYISEITKDNRIILTKENPEDKLKKIQTFILESKDKIIDANVAAVMNFGVIVNIGDLTGLVPIKEFKKNKIMANNYVAGDIVRVMFDAFENEKLVFRLPEKK
jgi:predicted RNA-binding protein with RPS1 domain